MKIKAVFIAVIFLATSVVVSSANAQSAKDTLENYCVPSEGAYEIPKPSNNPSSDDKIYCGTAPNICGIEYDRDGDAKVRKSNGDPVNWQSVNDCWDPEVSSKRCDGWGMCYGEVPLCCYLLEETGDAMKCAWPERGYCLPQQCDKVTGDKKNCGGSIGTWCSDDCDISKSDIPYIPLSQRVGGAAITPTSTVEPTKPPQATDTPPPGATNTPTPDPNATNTPTPTPEATVCETKQENGDYNCDDVVDDIDYSDWKSDFVKSKTTLEFFEYWRRGMY